MSTRNATLPPKRRHKNVAQFTNHIEMMKPTVPSTRIGGKSLTVSIPLSFRMVNAVVLDRASVGGTPGNDADESDPYAGKTPEELERIMRSHIENEE